MSVAEILNGESVNVEYKARVPEKSLNYMKTVVAFANGFGGRLVFGVADGTREIVGVDEADVFKMMDAIANAISDSCEPAIVPDIMLQTIAGKTVIVVDVLPAVSGRILSNRWDWMAVYTFAWRARRVRRIATWLESCSLKGATAALIRQSVRS